MKTLSQTNFYNFVNANKILLLNIAMHVVQLSLTDLLINILYLRITQINNIINHKPIMTI